MTSGGGLAIKLQDNRSVLNMINSTDKKYQLPSRVPTGNSTEQKITETQYRKLKLKSI